MLCFDDMILQFIGEIHLWPHTMEIRKIKTQLMVKLSQGFSCKYEVSRGFCVIVEHLKDGPDSGSLSAVHSLLSAHLQDLSCGTWGLPETQGNIHGHQWFKVKHPFVCMCISKFSYMIYRWTCHFHWKGLCTIFIFSGPEIEHTGSLISLKCNEFFGEIPLECNPNSAFPEVYL